MIYPATWLVLAVLAITLIVFGLGYYWALTHRQFEDVEAAKHRMLEIERGYHDERFLQSARRR